MSFWKRLRVYLLGLGIGSLMVLFFFGDRGCGGWLPGNRVKTSIMETTFVTSDRINCKLYCNEFTAESIANLVVRGSVNFEKSKTKENPREYLIEYENKQLMFSVPIDSGENVFIVDNFENKCPDCDTNSKKMDRKIKLKFPKK